MSAPTTCPAELKLPLGKFFNGKKTADVQTAALAGLECNGGKLAVLQLKRKPSFWHAGHTLVTLVSSTYLKPGVDMVITLDYTFLQGEHVLAHQVQSVSADEGDQDQQDPLLFELDQTG